jgi:hypothetical protein
MYTIATADMMTRIAIAGFASFCLGAAALAQNDNGIAGGSSTQQSTPDARRLTTAGLPIGWTARIKSAFFAGGSSPTLLAYDVIRQRWSALSSVERSRVTGDCQRLAESEMADNKAGQPDSGAEQATGDNSNLGSGERSGRGSGAQGDATAPSVAAGSSTYTPPSSTRLASMKQVCDIIGRI